MFEALEKESNERTNTEETVQAPKETPTDPLLEGHCSEELISEDDFAFSKVSRVQHQHNVNASSSCLKLYKTELMNM